MRRMGRFGAITAILVLGLCGHATAQQANIDQFLDQYLPEQRADVVSWRIISRVDVAVDGDAVVLVFDDRVAALEGEQIRVQGFVYPLESKPAQNHFLLTALPPHCPYCTTAGPELMMEVFSEDDVYFSHSPIVMTGTLEVDRANWRSTGMLYQLRDARVAQD